MALIYLIIFFIGASIGSFILVVAYRLPRNIDFIHGRSFCEACQHKLAWYNLIPIISYILQAGKCSYCGNKLSIKYPLIEFIAGLCFILIFHTAENNLLFLLNICFFSMLLLISIIDFETYYIYDTFHIIILTLSIIKLIYLQESIMNYIFSLCIIGIPLFLVYIFTKDKLGGGDVKLMAVCGAYLGIPNIILSFVIGTLSAAIYGIYLIIFKQKNTKAMIAYGPFLCFGCFISLIYGTQIINWYLNLFI